MFPWRITPVNCIHWSHLIVLLSTFQICRTSVSLWDLFLYFWWHVNFPVNSFPWSQMLPMSKTKTFTTFKNVCCCLVLHLLRIGPESFALDHSPYARKIWILTTCLILRRCQSPCHRHGWLFTFNGSLRSYMICVSTFSSASLSWSKRLTDTGTQLENRSPCSLLVLSQPSKKRFRFPEHSNRIGALTKQDLTVLTIGIFGLWFGLLGVFTTSSNFWTQFFHPIVLKGNLRRRSRWRIYFLVYDFSRSHHDSLRDTIGWKRVVKDDCVRSCLIELKSFLLSKFDVDPTPCFDVSSTLSACAKQDAVHPSQLHPDLCVPCSLDPQTWRIPSVICSNFVLPVSILNSWWSVNWSHIRCDKCTRRGRSE